MTMILDRITAEQGILHTYWTWWFSSLKKKPIKEYLLNLTYIEVEKNVILTDKKINPDICAK